MQVFSINIEICWSQAFVLKQQANIFLTFASTFAGNSVNIQHPSTSAGNSVKIQHLLESDICFEQQIIIFLTFPSTFAGNSSACNINICRHPNQHLYMFLSPSWKSSGCSTTLPMWPMGDPICRGRHLRSIERVTFTC